MNIFLKSYKNFEKEKTGVGMNNDTQPLLRRR